MLEELGMKDLAAGSALYQALKLSPLDLKEPTRFNQLKEIAAFLNQHPDPAWLVTSITAKNKSPHRSNLEHLASYVKLANEKMEHQTRLEALEKELKYYE